MFTITTAEGTFQAETLEEVLALRAAVLDQNQAAGQVSLPPQSVQSGAPAKSAKVPVMSRSVMRHLKAEKVLPYGLRKPEAAEFMTREVGVEYAAPEKHVADKIHLRRCVQSGCTHRAHKA